MFSTIDCFILVFVIPFIYFYLDNFLHRNLLHEIGCHLLCRVANLYILKYKVLTNKLTDTVIVSECYFYF